MLLHCIRLLRFTEDLRISDILGFFFNIQILSTPVSSHGLFSLFISNIYVRYTF